MFLKHVLSIDTDECIYWPGYRRKSDGRPLYNGAYVYRLVWKEIHGDVPDNLHHTCEDGACVNIKHLSPIEQSDHIKEHGLPGDNHNYLKTTCPQGHEYDYLWTDPNTGREERGCKTCRIENKKRYAQKHEE